MYEVVAKKVYRDYMLGILTEDEYHNALELLADNIIADAER